MQSFFFQPKEDTDDIMEMQLSPQPQESITSSQRFITDRKRYCTIPSELAEISAQQMKLIFDDDDVVKAKKTKVEEDDCDLYGRLLAKAMRNFNEIDRLELRHEIDGLIIKKKRSLFKCHYIASPSEIVVSTNGPPTPQIIKFEHLMDDWSSSP